MRRLCWATNGALGWGVFTSLLAVECVLDRHPLWALEYVAWIPVASGLGAAFGLLGVPTPVTPQSAWEAFKERR